MSFLTCNFRTKKDIPKSIPQIIKESEYKRIGYRKFDDIDDETGFSG